MVQERRPLRAQCELLQIDGIAEEGERGRGSEVEGASYSKVRGDTDFKCMEEWEQSRIGLREPLNVHPVAVYKGEVPDLLSTGEKQR